jgi:uncharacterized protein
MPRSIPRRAFDTAFMLGTVLISQQTLDELDEVLRRPKFSRYVQEEERLHFLSAYVRDAQIVEITVTVNDCRDAKDNKFLELAICGAATCIISGDQDLLILNPYRGVDVLTSHAFLEADPVK